MFRAPRHHETEGSQRTQVLARLIVALACAALASLMVAPTAAARQDDAHLLQQNASSALPCPLERIAHQFVRCDNLTGAGLPAPPYVPESR
jgi:hypothetical protein